MRLFEGDGHSQFYDQPKRSSNLFRHVAKSCYEQPGYSCPRIEDYGGTKADVDAWSETFMHAVDFLKNPYVGFWDIASDPFLEHDPANDNRVWALLLAHAMRQTGDL